MRIVLLFFVFVLITSLVSAVYINWESVTNNRTVEINGVCEKDPYLYVVGCALDGAVIEMRDKLL